MPQRGLGRRGGGSPSSPLYQSSTAQPALMQHRPPTRSRTSAGAGEEAAAPLSACCADPAAGGGWLPAPPSPPAARAAPQPAALVPASAAGGPCPPHLPPTSRPRPALPAQKESLPRPASMAVAVAAFRARRRRRPRWGTDGVTRGHQRRRWVPRRRTAAARWVAQCRPRTTLRRSCCAAGRRRWRGTCTRLGSSCSRCCRRRRCAARECRDIPPDQIIEHPPALNSLPPFGHEGGPIACSHTPSSPLRSILVFPQACLCGGAR